MRKNDDKVDSKLEPNPLIERVSFREIHTKLLHIFHNTRMVPNNVAAEKVPVIKKTLSFAKFTSVLRLIEIVLQI